MFMHTIAAVSCDMYQLLHCGGLQVNMSCPQNGAPVPSETLVYASSWWPAAEVPRPLTSPYFILAC